IIQTLPPSTSPHLIKGLTDAHHKLSDYYHMFDESPFYLWSSFLDPHISYRALKEEFTDDPDLAKHLKDATGKAELQTYFKENYPSPQASSSLSAPSLSLASPSSTSSISSSSGSPQKYFTARFQHKCTSPDELLEFWSLPQEDFEIIHPLQWWLGQCAQFPQLYHLAHDIFSIPGKVGVIRNQLTYVSHYISGKMLGSKQKKCRGK
ncbi:hypothetical protein BYT27DRAFT_7084757, partial [Phlegmacium glaucopus]